VLPGEHVRGAEIAEQSVIDLYDIVIS